MGIIKADAYGHGAVRVAEILREEKVRHFGVALIQEGVELRKNSFDEPILILGYTQEEDFPMALNHGLTLTIWDHAQAIQLDKCAKEIGKHAIVHLKVDTGMGRIGYFPNNSSVEEIVKISSMDNLIVEGIFSHLAWADNTESDFSDIQFLRFQEFIADLRERGIKIGLRHLSNSAGTINFPQMHLDLVRIGVSLYGLYPNLQMAGHPKIKLYPAMEIKSRLVNVKEVAEGTPLSYGCTYITKGISIIGTVPMGYADGIPRLLSNNGDVLVRGRRCPIVGRICMDQFMIDLTCLGNEVSVGDEIVILGSQGKDRISADEIAEKAGTISYEIVNRMSSRLPRKYIESE